MKTEQRPISARDLALVGQARQQLADGTARARRLEANVAQIEMAQGAGISPTTLALWEAGKRTPRGRAAINYARLLDGLPVLASEEAQASA